MEFDLAKEIRDLIVLNATVRNFKGPLGFRADSVGCLTRDGRAVKFAEASSVKAYLDFCLTHFFELLSEAQELREVAEACAYFWMTFICIHPFFDGNGRTAKSYIKKVLFSLNYNVRHFDLIDRYLIEGEVEGDLDKLTALFILCLIPIGGIKNESTQHHNINGLDGVDRLDGFCN